MRRLHISGKRHKPEPERFWFKGLVRRNPGLHDELYLLTASHMGVKPTWRSCQAPYNESTIARVLLTLCPKSEETRNFSFSFPLRHSQSWFPMTKAKSVEDSLHSGRPSMLVCLRKSFRSRLPSSTAGRTKKVSLFFQGPDT